MIHPTEPSFRKHPAKTSENIPVPSTTTIPSSTFADSSFRAHPKIATSQAGTITFLQLACVNHS